jgi:parvulin-like peptidyl-prolyl isomerase
MYKYLISAIAIFSIIISCGDKKAGDASTTSNPSNGTVLAKVNGETLTYEDLLQQFPTEYRDQIHGKDLQDAVDTWVNTQLLSEAGTRKGLDKDPNVLAVLKFRKSDAIARRLVENDITNGIAVTPAEIDSAFNEVKGNYVRASHILVKTSDEAEAIYNRLKKGDDFGKLAADYSLDKMSAANGGDIGYFTLEEAGQLGNSFAQTLGSLKVGEFSKPVQSDYGYHLIKITSRPTDEKGTVPMELSGRLSQDILREKQNKAYNDLLDSLKKDAKIERFTPPGLGLEDIPKQG